MREGRLGTSVSEPPGFPNWGLAGARPQPPHEKKRLRSDQRLGIGCSLVLVPSHPMKKNDCGAVNNYLIRQLISLRRRLLSLIGHSCKGRNPATSLIDSRTTFQTPLAVRELHAQDSFSGDDLPLLDQFSADDDICKLMNRRCWAGMTRDCDQVVAQPELIGL